MNYQNEEESEDEQVGLLSANILDDEDKNGAYNSNNNIGKMVKKKRKKKHQLRPLPFEVMHKASELKANDNRKLQLKFHDHESSKFACHTGVIYAALSIALGIWFWSSHQIKFYSGVQQYHDLRIDDIQHWCLDKSSSFCPCSNPLTPKHRMGHRSWKEAHYGNVREAAIAGKMGNIDVVFLGDNIVEEWRGLSYGKLNPNKEQNAQVFENLFWEGLGYNNADFDGLALGISGDKTFNLLWRLQNGELPDSLRPGVWWISIGTNDFGHGEKKNCSVEVVLMGILRVIEEVRAKRPNALIVVNSILPRSENGDAAVTFSNGKPMPLWKAISEVNRELEEYCFYNHNLYYFDATSIFLSQKPKSKATYISDKMMVDFLNPTAKGYQKWGEAIVEEMHSILDASKVEGGRRPITSTIPSLDSGKHETN